MKIRLYFLFVIFCAPVFYAQNGQYNADSLTKQLVSDSLQIYRPTFAKPYLRIESRNSFINREPVRLFGFLAGATLKERHILSAGFYLLDKWKESPLTYLDQQNNANHFLSLYFFDASYQYILFNYKYVQLNIPLEAGYGKYKVTSDSANTVVDNFEGGFVPLGLSLQFIFKPIRWLGISTVGGYRYVKNKDVTLRLRGFYYSVGVWIDARQILRDLRYRKAKKKYRRSVARER